MAPEYRDYQLFCSFSASNSDSLPLLMSLSTTPRCCGDTSRCALFMLSTSMCCFSDYVLVFSPSHFVIRYLSLKNRFFSFTTWWISHKMFSNLNFVTIFFIQLSTHCQNCSFLVVVYLKHLDYFRSSYSCKWIMTTFATLERTPSLAQPGSSLSDVSSVDSGISSSDE